MRNLGSRKKRTCEMCEKLKNLAFDSERRLCADCLVIRRQVIADEHMSGRISFHDAHKEMRRRLRMNEEEILELLSPPMTKEDAWQIPEDA